MIYQIENLAFSYTKKSPLVFENLNLSLKQGELLTILGHNGCGKSTLFSCMLGIRKPSSGRILLDGKDIASLKPRQIARLVGYVPQTHTPTFPYTVFDFVLMGCAAGIGLLSHPGEKEKKRAEEALREMGLLELSDRPYTELSGGERQQVTIARSIAASPKVILFDEPTAHLDFGKQMKVLRVIKDLSDKGYSVVITTHDPNHALMLGGKTALFQGREDGIIVGNPEELLTEERMEKVYGSELKLRYLEEFDRKVCIYPPL